MTIILFYVSSLFLSILGCLWTNHWLILWFWIELQSLTLIPVLSSNVTPRSIESTNKYFLFQATGSALLLMGIVARAYTTNNFLIEGSYSILELSILILALTIKLGVFPIHFWFVDVMNGLNYWSGFFVAILSKIIPLYVIMLLSSESSIILLNLVGVSSILIGSIFGVHQIQLRKLIALSSIAHIGWMILVFSSTSNTWFGIFLFLSYITMVLPLFWLGNKYNLEHLSKTNSIVNDASSSWILLLSLLSMAGFPPLLGFYYKWMILFNVTQTQSFFLIAILIGSSLLSLFFYIQICLSFYMLYWPVSKLLSTNFLYESNNMWFISPIIIITNLSVCYLLWVLNPIISNWIF